MQVQREVRGKSATHAEVCYRLVVFGSLVLLPRFLDLRSSEEFVARARVRFVSGGSSQGGFARASVASGSGPESCLSWLERAFLARAVWVFLRSIENFLARARVFCVWSLERLRLRSSERRGRGARRGRPARQEVPLQGEIPAVQEGVGQANVAEPVGQQAMGALAREIAGALGILRAGNQAAEAGPSFLKREFFRSNPDEFIGDPKEPLKADEWLEQMSKTFEMLGIEDGALKVTLASFQLTGDAGQWWKYEKARVGGTWEAFINAFQERFLSAAAREKLRDQFSRLNQQGLSVAEFEATFTSLSRFAPELVASEERRCYEFERKLRRGLKLRVGGSYIREYRHLVDAAAHMELMMQEEDEGQRGSKRSQDSQGDGRRQRGSNPQQSQGGVARSTFPVPSAGFGRGGQGEFTCYKCGQLGHKVSVCPQKGGGQRAASSSARPQSQSLGRGQPLSCYQCGQPGHLKRFCPQLSATSGASGSRQTQGFQPAQSVQASRANPGASSSQSVQ
ncbi:hypothetical protein HYC85_030701 [Camellia sinensis]|uniref:CCHC-type domain-containing protein n=1 Tax=Camellia sinensis TaxID=4442 RepID=A0A7J7G1D9_CAMSI|nr:hypothetical protein HYC85_030701 [Camellia sinensis]